MSNRTLYSLAVRLKKKHRKYTLVCQATQPTNNFTAFLLNVSSSQIV